MKWKRESEKKKEVKMKVGYKVCRFAQFPDGKKAILPEILQSYWVRERLQGRKQNIKQ